MVKFKIGSIRSKKFKDILESSSIKAQISKRKYKDKLFKACSMTSVGLLMTFIVYVLFFVGSSASKAVFYVEMTLDISNIQYVQNVESRDIFKSIFQENVIKNGLDISEDTISTVISPVAYVDLKRIFYSNNLSKLNLKKVNFPASSVVYNFLIGRDVILSDKVKKEIKNLFDANFIKVVFKKRIFTSYDSRFPEGAGLLGAFMSSFFVILICFIPAVPIGVMIGMFLSEFASKKSVFVSILEISTNNLVAVPSVIFGMIGLSLYIVILGIPRSSMMVGGLTLSMMMLPIIAIATRNICDSMPNSIRYAALALGATRTQVLLHHTLSFAVPGIITGTLIGIARIVGETAPLLMIGMLAFVNNIPQGVFDVGVVIPIQIYLWSSSPQEGFMDIMSFALSMLLIILFLLNYLTNYCREYYNNKYGNESN